MDPNNIEALKVIQEELARQGKLLESLENRLTRIEGLEAPAAHAALRPEEMMAPSAILEPPSPPPYVPPSGRAEKPFLPDVHWEAAFGGNWMVRIGVVAILVGLSFFLALAIQNDWIGPKGQIALGVLSGLALMGAGEYWNNRYPRYAQALVGGGIGVLYLSIYAAFGFYEFIGVGVAFTAMAFVTVASAFLAIFSNAPAIAVLGILGGFATPLLLFRELSSALPILGYIAVLNIGVLVISRYYNWQPFTLIALLGTALLSFVGYGTYYKTEYLALFEGFLTIYFFTFVASTLFTQILEKKRSTPFDIALMSGNALHYFLWTYVLLSDGYDYLQGFFTAFLGGFYLFLSWMAFPKRDEDVALMRVLLGIAVVFLVLAVPVQFSDRVVTMAWALEGAMLIWLGMTLREYILRFFGLGVFVLTLTRLFVIDTPIRTDTFTPIFNERFLTFIITLLGFGAGLWLYGQARAILRPEEEKVKSLLKITMHLVTFWFLSAEIISYFNFQEGDTRNAMNLSLSIFWMIYAVSLLVVGFSIRSRGYRIGGIVLFLFVILKVFLYDILALTQGFRVASFLTLGVILLASGFLYQRYKTEIHAFLKASDNEPGNTVKNY